MTIHQKQLVHNWADRVKEAQPRYVRVFYCTNMACTGVQIDCDIIHIMESERSLSPEKTLLLTLINEGELITTYDSARVVKTTEEIFLAFEAAR